MRIVLIRPPAQHTVESEVPPAVETENLSYPPLSLLTLASFLQAHSAHEVHVLDAQGDGLSFEALGAKLEQLQPEIVGVTAFTVSLVDVQKTISLARSMDSVQHVVLGGPHVNDFPEESRQMEGVDAAVKGEGQRPVSYTHLTLPTICSV